MTLTKTPRLDMTVPEAARWHRQADCSRLANSVQWSDWKVFRPLYRSGLAKILVHAFGPADPIVYTPEKAGSFAALTAAVTELRSRSSVDSAA